MFPVSLSQKIEVLVAQPELWTNVKENRSIFAHFIHSMDFNSEREELIDLHLSAGENTTGRVDEILKLLEIDPLECLVDRAA